MSAYQLTTHHSNRPSCSNQAPKRSSPEAMTTKKKGGCSNRREEKNRSHTRSLFEINMAGYHGIIHANPLPFACNFNNHTQPNSFEPDSQKKHTCYCRHCIAKMQATVNSQDPIPKSSQPTKSTSPTRLHFYLC